MREYPQWNLGRAGAKKKKKTSFSVSQSPPPPNILFNFSFIPLLFHNCLLPRRFGIDDAVVMTPLDSSVGNTFGRSDKMTILDKYKLNDAYSCPDLPASCGGLIQDSSGVLETTTTECRWDFVAPFGSVVLVTFHTVEVIDEPCYNLRSIFTPHFSRSDMSLYNTDRILCNRFWLETFFFLDAPRTNQCTCLMHDLCLLYPDFRLC